MTRVFICKAIVFDLDGVLADSTQAVNKAWEAWSKRRGIDPVRAIETGHGRTTIEAVRELAPQDDALASFAEMEALETSFLDTVVPVNGAPEFVANAIDIGIPWAVATSSSRNVALPRLERCKIPLPPVLVTADDVANGKPDPEPYEKAAGDLAIPASDCVVFEDAPSGMLSARRAGANVIAIGSYEIPFGPARHADAAARDFIDVVASRNGGRFAVATEPAFFRCPCCDCHTLAHGENAPCPLCGWRPNGTYALEEARRNVSEYQIMYRPSDRAFAIARHPVLGPNGESAIDRVALRARAYFEFREFDRGTARERVPARLLSLLACISEADRLYTKKA